MHCCQSPMRCIGNWLIELPGGNEPVLQYRITSLITPRPFDIQYVTRRNHLLLGGLPIRGSCISTSDRVPIVGRIRRFPLLGERRNDLYNLLLAFLCWRYSIVMKEAHISAYWCRPITSQTYLWVSAYNLRAVETYNHQHKQMYYQTQEAKFWQCVICFLLHYFLSFLCAILFTCRCLPSPRL